MSIPKVIHYCWFGDKSLPESAEKCIQSWKKHCPDYEIKRWTEKDFDFSLNEYCYQAYQKKAWGFVPDYIRLWIIYNYGGIYLDTDVQIIKNFDPLLNFPAFAGFEYGTTGQEGKYLVNLGQGFGAEPHNPIIGEQMHFYDNIKFILDNKEVNRIPSPEYTTQVLETHGLVKTNDCIQNLGEIIIFPHDYFCPKSFADGIIRITKNTFSIHQFDSSWFSEEDQSKKNARWKAAQKYYKRLWPNRLIRKIFGDQNIEKLKKYIGRG